MQFEDDDYYDENRTAGTWRKSDALYDPVLIEELEEVFHDAHDHIE